MTYEQAFRQMQQYGGRLKGSGTNWRVVGGNAPPSLTEQYKKMEAEAKAKNVAREKEIRGIYTDILNAISGSESSLRAAGLADIERQAGQLVGQETQQMISSGLYGTTTAAAIPRNVATSFTRPARLKLEDLLATRKREAQLGLAGFVERIETPYPDYNALMQAQVAQASIPRTQSVAQSSPSPADTLKSIQSKYQMGNLEQRLNAWRTGGGYLSDY